jgi:uncharacterized protein YndB with AHSA1/START domain
MKSIKKEITISAPATTVWEYLTSSVKIAGWFLPNDFEPKVGKRFTLNCEDHHESVVCEVKEVLPPKKLAYTFRTAAMQFETLVTFTLQELGQRTKLTLVHSGWDRLKPEDANLLEETEQGWGSRFLLNLKAALEADE